MALMLHACISRVTGRLPGIYLICLALCLAVSACGARTPCPAAAFFDAYREMPLLDCTKCEDPWKDCADAFGPCEASGRLSDRDEASRQLCLAGSAMMHDDHDVALSHVSQAEKLAPDWVIVHHFKTNLNLRLGFEDRALQSALAEVNVDPEWGWGFMDLATVHFLMGDLVAAEMACRTFLEIEPDEAAGHWMLSVIVGNLGDAAAAVYHMERAVELDPENPKYAFELFELLSEIHEVHGDDYPEFVDALKAAGDRLVEMMPDDIEVLVDVAYSKSLIGDWEGALPIALEALDSVPGHPGLLYTVAMACSKAGDCSAYMSLFEDLSGMDPRAASVIMVTLGSNLAELNRMKEAQEMIGEAVVLDPSNAMARTFLAALWIAVCDPADALEQVEKALAMEPDLPPALMIKGEVLTMMGKHDEALEISETLIEKELDVAAGHLVKATVMSLQDKPEKAIDLILEALEIQPERTTFLPTLVESYITTGDLVSARKYAGIYCEEDEKSASCMSLTGLLDALEGKHEEGIGLCRKSAELYPELASVWLNLSRALAAAGEKKEAEAAYEKAMAISPILVGKVKLGPTEGPLPGSKSKASKPPAIPSCKLPGAAP